MTGVGAVVVEAAVAGRMSAAAAMARAAATSAMQSEVGLAAGLAATATVQSAVIRSEVVPGMTSTEVAAAGTAAMVLAG